MAITKAFLAASWCPPRKSPALMQEAVKSVALIFYNLNIFWFPKWYSGFPNLFVPNLLMFFSNPLY